MRGRLLALVAFLLAAIALASDAPDARASDAVVDDIAPDVPMAAHADNVASYTLHATLDPALHTVAGKGTITWRNTSSKAISELWMHLYLNAFKNQSSEFIRAPIGGFRGNRSPTNWGSIDLKKLVLVDGKETFDLLPKVETKRPNDEDETDARIPLPHELPAGKEITLEVEWNDNLPTIVERTGYDGSFHMVAQWFPKLARLEKDGTFAHFPFHHLGEFYSDFGRYDVTIDVPERFIVGATGPRIESKKENGRSIERHVQEDIHDFAWTAWDKFETRTEVISGVEVTTLSPPGYSGAIERELETMRFALPHFGALYGRYPYSVLTIVHPPSSASEAGGMEYPTLITTGDSPWVRGINLVEIVTIHEFGHQYFYGLLASNEDAWPFLDEGLNSYAENEAMRAWKGPASAIDILGLRIGIVDAQSLPARQVGHDEKIAQGAGDFATGTTYGGLVYSRTATLLESIAGAFGRGKMERALGVYARRFRFRHPTPNDLIATFASEIGPEAAETLRIGLFEKGWVDYTITQMSSHPAHPPAGMFDRNGTRETVRNATTTTSNRYDGSALVVRRGTLHFPVEIELVAADGTRSRVTWNGEGESYRVPYSGTSPLRAAVVDPDNRLLLDDNPTNNFATASGQPWAGAPRVLERATFWATALLGAIAP